jgi:ribonuclease HII
VAAAVILDPSAIPQGINDSKKLSAKERERLDKEIRATALCFAIGIGEVDEIDSINIFQASKAAMVRAVNALTPAPTFLLLDGNFAIESPLAQRSLVGGDRISVSIAAASIIAKVYRDNLMQEFELKYPGYFFAKNKGYGSAAHRVVLEEKGPCDIHRKSFSWTPVRAALSDLVPE